MEILKGYESDDLLAARPRPPGGLFAASREKLKPRHAGDRKIFLAERRVEFIARQPAQSIREHFMWYSGQDKRITRSYSAPISQPFLQPGQGMKKQSQNKNRYSRRAAGLGLINCNVLRYATNLALCVLIITLPIVVVPDARAESTAYHLPRFRQVESGAPAPSLPAGKRIRLLADENFPPFSFRAASGAPAGLAVELGLAACGEMQVSCEVDLRPLAELLPALANGGGDAILDGPLITDTTLGEGLLTRPWFRSLARFAVQSGNPLPDPSAPRLAGRRIAVQKDSAHAVWLAKYYAGATIVPFDTPAAAQEALRTGAVDALFGDDLRLIYWVAGQASRGCCRLLGGAFTDFATFSRNISFVVAPGNDPLCRAFDAALDRLQTKGITEKLFNAYVPLDPW